MEYLNNVHDNLNNINENNIKYYNLFDNPQLVFGNLNFSSKTVDFCKYPQYIQNEMSNFGNLATAEMKNLNSASCGCRLRFNTNSKFLIFKVKLKRKYDYIKIVGWGSSGFDIYELQGDNYLHRTVFAPMHGENCFAEKITVPPSGNLCIFLPNYNTIEECYIGVEKNSYLTPINYNSPLPILFYGNSVTQGAAASRSGNSFPNIISRKLNQDIINLSCSSCCRGTKSIAKLIGKINCDSIIIDYTRNAYDRKYFIETHESFYKEIRKYHPHKKIILMTSSCFNGWLEYDFFDEIVKNTYKHARNNGENTYLLNQRNLFKKDEYDCIVVDSSHYTDLGMFRIADALIKLLKLK